MTTAVDVVKLALGHRIVDVDRRKEQRARFLHLVQPVHTRRGLFANTSDCRTDPLPVILVASLEIAEQIKNDSPLLRLVLRIKVRDAAQVLELVPFVNQKRGVSPVVNDERGTATVGPEQRLVGAPPVLDQRLALPRIDGDSLRGLGGAAGLRTADHHRGSGVVLRREDVAGDPAHIGAKIGQGLDQDRCLHRHVQTTHDPRPIERLLALVLLPQRHQARHLLLGEPDLVATERRQRQVGYLVWLTPCLHCFVERVRLLHSHSRRSHSSLL